MGITETKAREAIVVTARSLFERGLTHGSTGNISVRIGDHWLVTPTGCQFRLDRAGAHFAARWRRAAAGR